MENLIVWAHCPKCNAEKNSKVIKEYAEMWQDEEYPICGSITFRILKCQGCNEVFIQKEELFSENSTHEWNDLKQDWEEVMIPEITYWPALVLREQPKWIWGIKKLNPEIASLLDELYSAVNNNLYILAAIGTRTVIDKATELLNIAPGNDFRAKLAELVKKEMISEKDRTHLQTLTNAGSAAAHRGWRPSHEDLEHMLDIMEIFLNRMFILSDSVEALRPKIPPRPPQATRSESK